jgi:hypothetical protein
VCLYIPSKRRHVCNWSVFAEKINDRPAKKKKLCGKGIWKEIKGRNG